LTGHLTPDFKTIAEFRKDNGGEKHLAYLVEAVEQQGVR
jgi:hypothetical protein